MREPGFYWVNYYGKWLIAEWREFGKWERAGMALFFDDKDFDEINETPITRTT